MHTTTDCTIEQKDSIKNAMQGALSLHKAGLKVFPLWHNDKTPMVNKWPLWAIEKCSNKTIGNYGVNDCNWAVATGPSNLIVVDIDTKTYDGYQTFSKLEEKYGPIPDTFKVLTPSGGLHIYFWDVKNKGPTGTNTLGDGIDTRGKGGYVVAPFSSIQNHIYSIESNRQIIDCPDWIYRKLQEVSNHKKQKSQDKLDNFDDSKLENSVAQGERNRYLYGRACALRGLGFHKDIILTTLFDINELECDPPLSNEEIAIIAESASKYKPNQTSAVRDFALIKSEGTDPLEAHRDLIDAEENLNFEVHDFTEVKTEEIERLEWVIKAIYLKRKVGFLAATGGTGKSILSLQQCVAIATGRDDIIGEKVEMKVNCWYHNGEESHKDIARRLSAISKYFEIPQSEMGALKYSGIEAQFKFLKKQGHNYIPNSIDIKKAVNFIQTNDIGVWVVDPFVKFYQGEENSSKDMDEIMQIFTVIAEKTECSILLVTHTNKAADSATGEMNAIRGSSAQANAAKVVLSLRKMTEEEQEKKLYESMDTNNHDRRSGPIERRRDYIRMDSAKQNFAPAADKASWFRHQSVLCHHKGGTESVGVLVPVKLTTIDPNQLTDATSLVKEIRNIVVSIMKELNVDQISVTKLAKAMK